VVNTYYHQSVCQFAKFEDSSLNRSQDIEGVPKFQKWVTWPAWPPLNQFCIFSLILTEFHLYTRFEVSKGDFHPENCEIIVLTPKGTHFLQTRVFRYCTLKSVSSLMYSHVQILALRKKKLLAEVQKVIFHIYAEKPPSDDNVTKFCMWVSLPDVIICTTFYL